MKKPSSKGRRWGDKNTIDLLLNAKNISGLTAVVCDHVDESGSSDELKNILEDTLTKICSEFKEKYKSFFDENFFENLILDERKFPVLMRLVFRYDKFCEEEVKRGVINDEAAAWEKIRSERELNFLREFIGKLRERMEEISEFQKIFREIEDYYKENEDPAQIGDLTEKMVNYLKDHKFTLISSAAVDPADILIESKKKYKILLREILSREVDDLNRKAIKRLFRFEELTKIWTHDFAYEKRKEHPIHLVSGGTKDERSLLLKNLALELTGDETIEVYYIPLNEINLEDQHLSLESIFFHYLKKSGFAQSPLLYSKNAHIVLIFEGIDELQFYEKSDPEKLTAQFLTETERKVVEYNKSQYRLKILLSGSKIEIMKLKEKHLLKYCRISDLTSPHG